MSTAHCLPIFSPTVSGQPTAALVLVENSEAMSLVWRDLRDKHLSTLFRALCHANPGVQPEVMVLESSSKDYMPINITLGQAGMEDITRLQLDFHPKHKLSIGKTLSAVELLLSMFHGQDANRHLIIIADSTPADELEPNVIRLQQETYHPWYSLAQHIIQANITCHMILNPNENTACFSELFYETLRLRGSQEVLPWFAADPETYLFRLSAGPSRATPEESRIAHPFIAPTIDYQSLAFPTNVPTPKQADDLPPLPETHSETPEPTLVSRLKEQYGLTKKKIYAAVPPRQPFCRDEPVLRGRYRQVSTPLLIPASPGKIPQGGSASRRDGHGISSSRGGRAKRRTWSLQASSSGVDARPQNLSSSSGRGGSRVSSPDSDDVILSSPTSVSTYGALMPAAMIHQDNGFPSSGVPSPVTPADDGFNPSRLDLVDSATHEGLNEPRWLQHHYPSSEIHLAHTYLGNALPSPKSNPYPSNPYPSSNPYPADLYFPNDEPGFPNSGTVPSVATGLDGLNFSQPPDSGNELVHYVSSFSPMTPSIDGDTSFIFSPEFEAAAEPEAPSADLWSGPRPAHLFRNESFEGTTFPFSETGTVDYQQDYPSVSHSRAITASAAPSLPGLDFSTSYDRAEGRAQDPYPAPAPYVGTSSLTGWAG